uniref:Uncharacterized protein n=1 Tax=Oryza nivara TaxID=4536 RepID=A0A0E0J4I4_ORYNI
MERIMVSAATGVMNSLLTKLTVLLGEEYKLQKRVKHGIECLKDELSSMNALLEKLADMDVLDPQMKDWRNQVREMAYDIEDCIDRYMLQLHDEPDKRAGMKGLFRNTIKKVKKLGARHEIGKQIKELRTHIDEASQRRYRYKLDAILDSCSTCAVETIDPRLSALYVEESSLVGIDGPMNELIKLVDDREQSLKVVSIVGFGGLGKTTLAKQVYKKVGEQFDFQAFVLVSQKPDVQKIFRNILSQIKDLGNESREVGWLIDELRIFLKDKRYFVVIDDIWSTQAWNIIKCALPENTYGCRILLTTRNGNVAKTCCYPQNDTVYEIRPLTEADSKGLFFRRIFGSEDRCPIHLRDVSVEIIDKCGGLPLALITIASLLNVKSKNREEWLNIRNSIGLGLEENSDIDDMKRILSLSYSDLPHHLKTCLLYLSMYPEDCQINVDHLLRRWRAEGFIKVRCGRNLMEEGEFYLNELMNRSLIQPEHRRIDGRAMTCRVHDIILDLIVSKAVEENFVTVVSDPSILVSQDKIRRLLLVYCGRENVMTMPSMASANVRSLGIFGYSEQMLPISDLHALRVLDIDAGNKMMEICDIRKLLQLRYLRILSPTHLPEQIGELQFLETLDLFDTCGIVKLPASIVKPRQLKCLSADCAMLPDGVGNMQALEELSVVIVDESSMNFLQELGSLIKLRRLGLRWYIPDDDYNRSTYGYTLALSLGKLLSSNLRYLQILGPRTGAIPLDFLSSSYHLMQELYIYPCLLHGNPERLVSLASVTSLTIRIQQVTQETLEILGDFSALLSLTLTSEDETTERLSVYSNKFGCLKYLHLGYLANGVMFHAGAMPKLETIDFMIKAHSSQSACSHQNLGIHHLSALKVLNVNIDYDCEEAMVEEVEALEAAIKNEASLLPNCSSQHIDRISRQVEMVTEGWLEGDDVMMEQQDEMPSPQLLELQSAD